MSSNHLVIVAKNFNTGELELPLGNITMYGDGGEQSALESARSLYNPEWGLAIYKPEGLFVPGTSKGRDTRTSEVDDLNDALERRLHDLKLKYLNELVTLRTGKYVSRTARIEGVSVVFGEVAFLCMVLNARTGEPLNSDRESRMWRPIEDFKLQKGDEYE